MQVNGRPGRQDCLCQPSLEIIFAALTYGSSPIGVHFQDDGTLFQDKGFCKGDSLQAVQARAAAAWASGPELPN